MSQTGAGFQEGRWWVPEADLTYLPISLQPADLSREGD
jgi:hypothetical protein